MLPAKYSMISSVKILSEVETRVLGSLVEKELTTPDYYPLSLNALVNACNQKSNRDPAMNLNEDAVRQALRSLEKEGLAGPADGMDNRVTKFEHRFQETFNFDRREIAILCELLIRGPQTPGELRSRAERMYRFDDLGQVQSTLQRLAQREPPVVKVLPGSPVPRRRAMPTCYPAMCSPTRKTMCRCNRRRPQPKEPSYTATSTVNVSRVWRMNFRPFRTKLPT